MKTTIVKTALAMALLAGCGGTGLRQTGGDDPAAAGSSGQALQVDLRMRAVGTDKFQSLQVLADDIKVWADGVQVPVEVSGDPVELTDEQQAFRIGSLVLPAGTQEVQFEVKLAPAGVYDDGQNAGWLDARGTSLRFGSSIENLASKNKAVIEVNAAQSLVQRGDSVVVVPHFRVRY